MYRTAGLCVATLLLRRRFPTFPLRLAACVSLQLEREFASRSRKKPAISTHTTELSAPKSCSDLQKVPGAAMKEQAIDNTELNLSHVSTSPDCGQKAGEFPYATKKAFEKYFAMYPESKFHHIFVESTIVFPLFGGNDDTHGNGSGGGGACIPSVYPPAEKTLGPYRDLSLADIEAYALIWAFKQFLSWPVDFGNKDGIAAFCTRRDSILEIRKLVEKQPGLRQTRPLVLELAKILSELRRSTSSIVLQYLPPSCYIPAEMAAFILARESTGFPVTCDVVDIFDDPSFYKFSVDVPTDTVKQSSFQVGSVYEQVENSRRVRQTQLAKMSNRVMVYGLPRKRSNENQIKSDRNAIDKCCDRLAIPRDCILEIVSRTGKKTRETVVRFKSEAIEERTIFAKYGRKAMLEDPKLRILKFPPMVEFLLSDEERQHLAKVIAEIKQRENAGEVDLTIRGYGLSKKIFKLPPSVKDRLLRIVGLPEEPGATAEEQAAADRLRINRYCDQLGIARDCVLKIMSVRKTTVRILQLLFKEGAEAERKLFLTRGKKVLSRDPGLQSLAFKPFVKIELQRYELERERELKIDLKRRRIAGEKDLVLRDSGLNSRIVRKRRPKAVKSKTGRRKQKSPKMCAAQ